MEINFGNIIRNFFGLHSFLVGFCSTTHYTVLTTLKVRKSDGEQQRESKKKTEMSLCIINLKMKSNIL